MSADDKLVEAWRWRYVYPHGRPGPWYHSGQPRYARPAQDDCAAVEVDRFVLASALEASEAKIAALTAENATLRGEVERAAEDERDRLLKEAVGRQVGPQGWRDIAAFLKAQGARGPAARAALRKEGKP